MTLPTTGGEEDTDLLISELNQTRLIFHNLILLGLAILKQLRQSKPLPGHLVPIICIHELIVVHAIRCIPLDLLDGRLAAVEVENVVDESLALFGDGKGFGRVWRIVFRRVGLAGLVVLARGGGGKGGGFHLAVCRHCGGGGGEGSQIRASFVETRGEEF